MEESGAGPKRVKEESDDEESVIVEEIELPEDFNHELLKNLKTVYQEVDGNEDADDEDTT